MTLADLFRYHNICGKDVFVVTFAKGLPFSKLPIGKQSINGHRVQVKEEYLANSISSIEGLVTHL